MSVHVYFIFRSSPASYIVIPNNGNLDVRYSITVMMWFRPTSLRTGALLEYVGAVGVGTHFWINAQKLYVRKHHHDMQLITVNSVKDCVS